MLDKLVAGQSVYAVDDRFVGEVRMVSGQVFRVVGPDLDVWLRTDAVFTADQTVTLICNREQVPDYGAPRPAELDEAERAS